MGSLKSRLFKAAAVPVAAAMIWGVSVSDAGAAVNYTVRPGDSLWTIACKHQTTVDTIVNANSLGSSLIFPGQTLSVPSASPAASAPASAQAGNSSATSAYIVQKGDTLSAIGQRHGVSVRALKAANGLSGDALFIGQKLVLPDPRTAAPTVSRSGDRAAAVVDYARKHLGTPYSSGGSSPGGFDCSGFAYHVYGHFGVSIPRVSYDQYKAGAAVSRGQLRPGDLVFFSSNGPGASHTGIYVGNNQFIHSSSPRSGGVIYSSMGDGYYGPRYVGARRILP